MRNLAYIKLASCPTSCTLSNKVTTLNTSSNLNILPFLLPQFSIMLYRYACEATGCPRSVETGAESCANCDGSFCESHMADASQHICANTEVRHEALLLCNAQNNREVLRELAHSRIVAQVSLILVERPMRLITKQALILNDLADQLSADLHILRPDSLLEILSPLDEEGEFFGDSSGNQHFHIRVEWSDGVEWLVRFPVGCEFCPRPLLERVDAQTQHGTLCALRQAGLAVQSAWLPPCTPIPRGKFTAQLCDARLTASVGDELSVCGIPTRKSSLFR